MNGSSVDSDFRSDSSPMTQPGLIAMLSVKPFDPRLTDFPMPNDMISYLTTTIRGVKIDVSLTQFSCPTFGTAISMAIDPAPHGSAEVLSVHLRWHRLERVVAAAWGVESSYGGYTRDQRMKVHELMFDVDVCANASVQHECGYFMSMGLLCDFATISC